MHSVCRGCKNLIAILGITPTAPEIGYGYIQRAGSKDQNSAYIVERFVENPDAKTAQEYLDNGAYLWNGGMFVLRASTWLAALKEFRPDKEDKYGDARRAVAHLLLYVTDWKFLLSPLCIRLLASYCVTRRHQFKSIAYFVPVSMVDGIFTPLYPASNGVCISQPEEVNIRNSQLYQGNPETILPTENGAGVIFRF